MLKRISEWKEKAHTVMKAKGANGQEKCYRKTQNSFF